MRSLHQHFVSAVAFVIAALQCVACGSEPANMPGGCTRTSCVAVGAECGRIGDGCGRTLDCVNMCSNDEICGGGGVNRCGTEPCTPTTCEAQGTDCGTISDGCGDVLDCGTCETPPSCDGIHCSGHGTCSVGTAGPSCQCDSGYRAVGSACVSDTTDLGALATLVGTMTPGVWKEIPDTRMESVFLSRAQIDAIDTGIYESTGPAGVLDLWCGSAFDGRRWFFGACGGHHGYAGNEIYDFDLATLRWNRLYDPSPLTDVVYDDPVPEWGPSVPHTYDGFVYSARANALFVLWPRAGNGSATAYSWKYDLNEPDPSVAWQPFTSPSRGMPDGRWDQPYYKSAEDPVSGDIIFYGGANNASSVAALDPVTLTYKRHGGFWDQAVAGISVGDIDPGRRKMFSINDWTGTGSGVLAIDIDANPLANNQAYLGGPPPASPNSCFVHNSATGLMWAWPGLRETYTFNPDTGAWTHYANASGPAPTRTSQNNGPYSKCIYVPELDVFAGYNNHTQGVWLYRQP